MKQRVEGEIGTRLEPVATVAPGHGRDLTHWAAIGLEWVEAQAYRGFIVEPANERFVKRIAHQQPRGVRKFFRYIYHLHAINFAKVGFF